MFLSSFTSTEALLVPSKEISLEIDAEKTDYVVMSREQNEGRTHNIKTGSASFESMTKFKYLGTTLNA